MAEHDRFPLFTEARERLGRALVRVLDEAVPPIAGSLESGTPAQPAARAAAVLRAGATEFGQRAVLRFHDLSFLRLELNEAAGAGEAIVPTDVEAIGPRVIADDLARAIVGRVGVAAHARWVSRVDALTGIDSGAAGAPLGAPVLALAAVEALRPVSVEAGLGATLRTALLEHLTGPLAEALIDVDTWLARHDAQAQPAPGEHPVSAAEGPTPEVSVHGVSAAEVPAAAASAIEPAATESSATESSATESSATESSATESSATGASATAAPATGAPAAERQRTDPSAREPAVPPLAVPASAPADALAARAPDPTGPEVASGVAAAPGGSPPSPDGSVEQIAQTLVDTTRVADILGQRASPATPAQAEHRHAAALPKPVALEQDAVAFAHQVGVAPYTRAARQRFFDALRQRMRSAEASASQLAALDLVAALFDYVIDDARMPPAAQPLLWRLQHPAVTLAALDAGFLGDDRRSVRRLVENLAAISVAYADDLVLGSELHRRLETVVRAVEVVSHAFQSRSFVLGDQVRKEYDRASQGISQLVSRVAKERAALEATPGRRNRRDFRSRPSREREQEVTLRLEQDLLERLGRHDVPESVREFLLGVWLRHLRTAVLRDGEDSAQHRLSMQVVDDLLWSLDASGPRQSRRDLAHRIPPLIRMLTQGVTDIGARPEEFQPFLDELFLIHLRKMQRVPRTGDGEPGAAEPPVPAARGDDALPLPGLDRDLLDALDGLPVLEDRLTDPTVPSTADPRPAWRPATGDAAGKFGSTEAPGRMPPDRPEASPARPGGSREGDRGAYSSVHGADAGPGAADAAGSGDQRLLSLLGTLDLGDFPADPQRLDLDADAALARLRRGDWIVLEGRDGLPQEAKIAWINSRRTVVLLVRRPDRRALSLRASELHQRFAQRKAALLG